MNKPTDNASSPRHTEPELRIAKAVESYLARTGFGAFRPRAALIDMDGTLYDSMKNHTLAWKRLTDDMGLSCSRDEFYLYEGMTGADTIAMLVKRDQGREISREECLELYKVKTRYFNELPAVTPIPGAARMLATFMDRGIVRVLVTGSGQKTLITRLEGDFPGAFCEELKITSHETVHGKPHPEPYLNGMALAKVEPWQAIVVENAPLGVKSGHDSQAFTVAVTTGPIPRKAMTDAGADLVCASMEEFADLLPHLLSPNLL